MKAFVLTTVLVLASLVLAPRPVHAQMPDLSQMSGTPLPVGDLPAGTVTVRVVRDTLANNLPDQDVELHVGTDVRRTTTNATGRAEFSAVPAGAAVHAVAHVDGQRLTSQEFSMPSQGGVRLILVATGAGSAPDANAPSSPTSPSALPPAAAPAAPGEVVIGGQSRFVVDVNDEKLEVIYLLDISHGSTAAVAIEPLVFEVPADATNLTMLEGSSPQAKIDGAHRVVLSGPIQPGRTLLQMAYRLPYSGSTASFSQRLPAALRQVTVIVRKIGEIEFSSPQAPERSPVTMGDQEYVMTTGRGLGAGETLQFNLTGLPHQPTWPRSVALTLALGIMLVGVWWAARPDEGTSAAERAVIETEREQLFARLVELERAVGPAGVVESPMREELLRRLEELAAERDALDTTVTDAAASGAKAPVVATP